MKRGLIDILKRTEFQDCCANHCRDWRETKGGLPASNHAPSCPNYKTELFLKLTPKGDAGPWVIDEPKNIDEWMDNEEEYDIQEVQITRDQFEHLDEFEGF